MLQIHSAQNYGEPIQIDVCYIYPWKLYFSYTFFYANNSRYFV